MMNLSPPGARWSGFIVPSSERELSDQTDIDWTVILDPLGRWSLVCEKSSDWSPEGAGALGEAPFGLRFVLVASGVF